MTFRHAYGLQLNPALELSHTLNCGIRSSSNINPRHIIEESGVLNRTRINCFMYLDSVLRNSLPRQDRSAHYIASVTGVAAAVMHQCRAVHPARQCEVHWECWMEDHARQDMDQVYASHTESENEARVRLDGPIVISSSPGSGIPANSSQSYT